MKRCVVALLVFALVLAMPSPARAYLKFGLQVGATTLEIKWNGPVRYFVTEREIAGVSAAQFREAVTRAFASWQGVAHASLRTEFLGSTVASPGDRDGRTTLGFLDRPDLERVLGATSLTLNATTGEIVEAEVFFNARFDWSTAAAGQTGRVDLESVALHEIGHLLGLGHSAIGETEPLAGGGRRVIASAAVMFPIAMTPGSIVDRVLTADDRAGLLDLYPGAGVEASTGSIVGRVTRNGAGVFGAHVLAFNLKTGSLVGNFTLGSDGGFVIAGLEPGPHLIRAEPIDDAEPSSFLSSDVDVNFSPAFAPTMVIAPRGGSSHEVEVQVRPR